eukprot:1999502-Alexandrium_andersonii.AAC.1
MPPRMQEHVRFPTLLATPPPESAFVAYRAEQASRRTHPAGAAPGQWQPAYRPQTGPAASTA